MSTASTILATNAYLNPLLGTHSSSARAFSTSPKYHAKGVASDDSDPVWDRLEASIEGKHLAAGPQKKKNKQPRPESPKAKQAKEKPQLLRELIPEKAPTANSPQNEPTAFEGLTPGALAAKLADLEAKLATTKDFDWREIYREAQQATSLKNSNAYKNLSAAGRKTQADKSREAFKAKVQELNKNKDEHAVAVKGLEGSIEALKAYIAKQKTEEGVPNGKNDYVDVDEAAEEERMKKLEELRKRKEELLRRKDELAVRLAQLRAAQQQPASIQSLPPSQEALSEPSKLSSQQDSPTAAQTRNPQSPAAPPNTSSTTHNASTSFDSRSLRLHLPGGRIKIDANLTIDINAPTKFLRRQLSALQARLKQFHPPLDALPDGLKGAGNHQYMIKTWLKVLLSRYQAKTGVQGVIEKVEDEEQKGREKRFIERELSLEARERMAKRWNEKFAEKRGYVMPTEDVATTEDVVTIENVVKGEGEEMMKGRESESKPVERNDMEDDYNEMGFLQDDHHRGIGEEDIIARGGNVRPVMKDEYATEEEILTAKASSSTSAPAATPSTVSPLSSPTQQTVTTWDTGRTVPVPSTRPPFDSPNFAASVLHQPQNPASDQTQTQDEAIETLKHNFEAAEKGWGDEDDQAATRGLPPRYRPEKSESRDTSCYGREEGKEVKKAMSGRREYSTSSRPPRPQEMSNELDEIARQLKELNDGLEAKEEAEQQDPPSQSNREAASTPTTTAPAPTEPPTSAPHLPHLTSTGSAHMVSISAKAHTTRTAIAVGTVYFSNPTPLSLITSNSLKKGDVLSVSRVAGIMAAKKCPDIVPLCHPIPLTHVGVELRTFSPSSTTGCTGAADGTPSGMPDGADNMSHGGVQIECKVACTGATGVEMEALTAVMGTALSVVDMCKAVDKFQRIGDVRVVLKEGGKSGVWREESWKSWQHD